MKTWGTDLMYRFLRILHRWITQMGRKLTRAIFWPNRDALQKTMPLWFQESFGKKVAIIIDCFEIFIECPSNLRARTSTWSSYKHHNTAKVLLGCSPQGVISYVSLLMTEHSGILNNLIPGDVLADKGFDISDSLGAIQASLSIPASQGEGTVVGLGNRRNKKNCKCENTCRMSNWECMTEVYYS